MELFKELTDLVRQQQGLPPIVESGHDHYTWHLSHKMEDFALEKILDNVVINRHYEIPYVAGYSEDGKVIYIDKDMPESFKTKDGKTVKTDKYLVLHEAVEKALISLYHLNYFFAHQIAYRAEKSAVEEDKINWKEYDDFMMKWVKKIDHFERKQKGSIFPRDLDLTPYVDEKDKEFVKKLRKAESETT